MKLVWKHCATDGCTYWCDYVIPFEYSSKDDFVYHVLDMVKNRDTGTNQYSLPLLGIDYVEISELESIEGNVLTLEEWFEQNKQSI